MINSQKAIVGRRNEPKAYLVKEGTGIVAGVRMAIDNFPDLIDRLVSGQALASVT